MDFRDLGRPATNRTQIWRFASTVFRQKSKILFSTFLCEIFFLQFCKICAKSENFANFCKNFAHFWFLCKSGDASRARDKKFDAFILPVTFPPFPPFLFPSILAVGCNSAKLPIFINRQLYRGLAYRVLGSFFTF